MIYSVGLDLSLRSTGVVAVPITWADDFDRTGDLEWFDVKSDSFGLSLKKDATEQEHMKRMRYIASLVKEFCCRYQPETIWIEAYAYGQRSSSSHRLAELGGIVKSEICDIADIEVVNASSARKVLLGKVPRKNQKKAVQRAMISYDCPFETEDVFDAFVIANYGMNKAGHQKVCLDDQAKINFTPSGS